MKRQMQSLAGLILVALPLSLGGCAKDKKAEDKKEQKDDKATAKKVKTNKPKELSDRQIPAPEDFEEQAERQITLENLDVELAKTEKEIQAEAEK